MARLFGKSKEKDIQDEMDEYENSEEQREENRGRPQKLPPLPPRPGEKTMVVEREVTLSLLNEKLNYLISILEKELKE